MPWGTGSSLTVTHKQLSNGGCYQAVLSNPSGSATAAVATVAIRVLNWEQVAGLTIENPAGTTIRAEWLEDLQTWFPLINSVLPTSPYRFEDWESAGRPQRYHRLLPGGFRSRQLVPG